MCYENKGVGGEPTGELTIPSELARRWERQIETPYHELSEKEKNSDREQVDRYWKLITADRKRVELEARIDELHKALDENSPFGEGQLDIASEYAEYRIAKLKAQQEEANQ